MRPDLTHMNKNEDEDEDEDEEGNEEEDEIEDLSSMFIGGPRIVRLQQESEEDPTCGRILEEERNDRRGWLFGSGSSPRQSPDGGPRRVLQENGR